MGYGFCQPYLVTDINGNNTEICFDSLGMVIRFTAYGQTTTEGDSLDNFLRYPDKDFLRLYYKGPKSEAAYALLLECHSRFIYNLNRYRNNKNERTEKSPVYTSVIMREKHVSQTVAAGERSALQVSLSCTDGFGRESQRNVQGNAKTSDRKLMGSGWNIHNNKGLKFREYEPFFDDTHEYKYEKVECVSATCLYDPISRLVTTLHADHNWEKVMFSPWEHSAWDGNDTALLDPLTYPDVGYLFSAKERAEIEAEAGRIAA